MAKEGATPPLLQHEDLTVLRTGLCRQPPRPQPCFGEAAWEGKPAPGCASPIGQQGDSSQPWFWGSPLPRFTSLSPPLSAGVLTHCCPTHLGYDAHIQAAQTAGQGC